MRAVLLALLSIAIVGCGDAQDSSRVATSLGAPRHRQTIPRLPSCDIAGLVIAALPPGSVLSHTAADAQRAAAVVRVPDAQITGVVSALVTDPLASKVELPKTPRPMWVISRTWTSMPTTLPPGMHGGLSPYPVGTVFHDITLVDDASLRLGGNLECGLPQLPKVAEVSGHLFVVGGPAPGLPRAAPGSVTFAGSATKTVATSPNGSYTITLSPGAYLVTGESGNVSCRAEAPVTVSLTGIAPVDVYCHVR